MTLIQLLLFGSLISWSGNKKIGILLHKPDTNDLNEMNTLFESGKVIPVIDKVFPLDECIDAFNYYGNGHAKGKVVITMQN